MIKNLEISEITNPEKYRKDLRFTMDRVMAGGATVFKGLAENGTISKGVALVTNGTFYQFRPDHASE
jgi:hypothetical protein